MKIFKILFLFPILCHAAIVVEQNGVKPFELVDYPIQKLVQDYAESMKKTIIVERDFSYSKARINLVVNKIIPLQQFESIFYTLLESHGFSIVTEGSFSRVISSRDIRYSGTNFYASDEYPKLDQYYFVFHQLKYPLAGEITRNMRPFMSRYGRIIDFNDAHSIVIHDHGSNIKRLIELINILDNKEGFDHLVKNGGNKKRTKENNDSKEDLEIEILKLQKRKLESELNDESIGVKRRRS